VCSSDLFARTPPMVIGRCDRSLADRCEGLIRKAGGDAMVCEMRDIERLGGTMRIRDMRIVEGAIELDLWRGPTARVQTSHVQVLVRAHASKTESVQGTPMSRGEANTIVALGVGRMMGPVGALGSIARAAGAQPKESKTVTKDWLDIHTTDGSVFQIDGDKFGFQVLGDMRTQGDRHNMDRLLELLRHLSPNAVVDTYFSMFKAPPGAKRLRLPGMKINDEDPVFAFYSRWAAIMYRYVMGA